MIVVPSFTVVPDITSTHTEAAATALDIVGTMFIAGFSSPVYLLLQGRLIEVYEQDNLPSLMRRISEQINQTTPIH